MLWGFVWSPHTSKKVIFFVGCAKCQVSIMLMNVPGLKLCIGTKKEVNPHFWGIRNHIPMTNSTREQIHSEEIHIMLCSWDRTSNNHLTFGVSCASGSIAKHTFSKELGKNRQHGNPLCNYCLQIQKPSVFSPTLFLQVAKGNSTPI